MIYIVAGTPTEYIIDELHVACLIEDLHTFPFGQTHV
jgi:hypothetical protein